MDFLKTQLALCETEKILATKNRDEIKLEYDTLKPKYDTLQTTYDNLHNALANLDVDADVPGYSCIDYDEPTEAQFSRKPTPSSGINSSSIVFIIISLVFFVLFLTMLRGMMIGGK